MWVSAFLAEPAHAAPKYASLQPVTEWSHPLFRLHGYPDDQDAEAVRASEHQHQHLLSPSTPLHSPKIVQVWQNEQAGIIKDLNEMGGGLILSGDCR